MNAVSGFATLVWAPTGIALAAMLILGFRFWPGIMLAAFLINLVTGAPILVALGIGAGNTLEAVLGAYLLKRFTRFQPALERVRDVLGLVVLAGFVGTATAATVGVTSLLLNGTVSAGTYGQTWLAWWVGDMLGALVVAPLLLVWSGRPQVRFRPKRFAEASVYTVLLVGVSVIVFRGSGWFGIKPFTFAYVIFPILIWIALRFGQIGSVTATFVVSVVAVWGTIASFNPSADGSLSHQLLLLQSFMGISAVTFMTMAAVSVERERTRKHEQQLAIRTALLTKQRKRLLALSRAKDEFIAIASHQLRTPASSVKQYTGMLLENRTGKLTEAQHTMVRAAYESNERQLQVINDLLRVAQIDAGNIVLRLEKVDLAQLIMEILRAQDPILAARNQATHFLPGKRKFVATVDKERFRMALENLIDNAGKYSPPGQKLEITLSKNSTTLAIAVKDNGVGIAKKDLPKLFKKFSRVDNPLSVAAGGTGLGLYWTNKIISLHHGSITVTSEPNRGSTFTITLPNEPDVKHRNAP